MKKMFIFMLVILLTAGLFSACTNDNKNFIVETPSGSTGDEQNTGTQTTEPETTTQRVEVGDDAPDFSVELLSGDTVKLSDFRGKVVLVHFWAMWYNTDDEEMADIQRLCEEYPEDLVVITINCDDEDGITGAEDFIKSNGYTFYAGLDPDGVLRALYAISGLPYTIIIGEEGFTEDTYMGAEDLFDVCDGYVKKAIAW